MSRWNNIKAKVSAAVIAAFFMGSPVGAEEFTGELKYACEAVLCLSSSTRPSECSPALNYFFNIKHKRIDKTIKARLNFLNLCPASSETPDMKNLVSALSRGSGRCDAEALNRELRWCSGSRKYSGYLHITDVMPDYCRALHGHSYTQLPPSKYVGDNTRFGRWVEAVDYERELVEYEERMRLLGNRYKGTVWGLVSMSQTTTPVAEPTNENSPVSPLTDEQRIDALITRWFEINGQKVDKNDPTMPLLLLVDERLERAELQMQTQLQQLESVQWQHFLLEMDKRGQQLKKDLQVLEGAKEQFMAQLDRTNRENVFEFASETGGKIEKALFSIKVFGGVFVGVQLLTLVVFLFFAFKG